MSAIDNPTYLQLHGFTYHRRGCPANKGRSCDCGMQKARNEFIELFEKMEKDILDLRDALKPFSEIQINVTGSCGILYANEIRRAQSLLDAQSGR